MNSTVALSRTTGLTSQRPAGEGASGAPSLLFPPCPLQCVLDQAPPKVDSTEPSVGICSEELLGGQGVCVVASSVTPGSFSNPSHLGFLGQASEPPCCVCG